MSDFMISGRATPFQPRGVALRQQAQNAQAATGQRIIPRVEREIAQHAAGLLVSEAFMSVVGALIDNARQSFENSPYGKGGDDTRAMAHARIAACNEILVQLHAMADDAKIYDRIEVEQAEHD
jgi:hypothetical protein